MFWQRKLNLPYLVLLSASHHIEEEINTALIDNGHPLQESYLIYREKEETDGLGIKGRTGLPLFYSHNDFIYFISLLKTESKGTLNGTTASKQ